MLSHSNSRPSSGAAPVRPLPTPAVATPAALAGTAAEVCWNRWTEAATRSAGRSRVADGGRSPAATPSGQPWTGATEARTAGAERIPGPRTPDRRTPEQHVPDRRVLEPYRSQPRRSAAPAHPRPGVARWRNWLAAPLD